MCGGDWTSSDLAALRDIDSAGLAFSEEQGVEITAPQYTGWVWLCRKIS